MQALANLLTVLGIAVTLYGYFGQRSGFTLADLSPGLTARWARVQGWVRRTLGLTKTVSTSRSTTWAVSAVGAATLMVWSPIQPGDDIAVRATKLERNLEALRDHVNETQAHDHQRLREVTDGLAQRITDLDQRVAQRYDEDRQRETHMMRMEVTGLIITLVGVGLSTVATWVG